MPACISKIDQTNNPIQSSVRTTYLELLQLHFLLLHGVLGVQTQGIKSETTRLTIELIHVGNGSPLTGLQEGDPAKNLNHGFGEGIMSIDYTGDRLEAELFSGHTDEFGDDQTGAGQHGGTAVLQFRLAEPRNPLGCALCSRG